MFWYILAFYAAGNPSIRISVRGYPTMTACIQAVEHDPVIAFVDSRIKVGEHHNLMSVSCVDRATAHRYNGRISLR